MAAQMPATTPAPAVSPVPAEPCDSTAAFPDALGALGEQQLPKRIWPPPKHRVSRHRPPRRARFSRRRRVRAAGSHRRPCTPQIPTREGSLSSTNLYPVVERDESGDCDLSVHGSLLPVSGRARRCARHALLAVPAGVCWRCSLPTLARFCSLPHRLALTSVLADVNAPLTVPSCPPRASAAHPPYLCLMLQHDRVSGLLPFDQVGTRTNARTPSRQACTATQHSQRARLSSARSCGRCCCCAALVRALFFQGRLRCEA